MKIEETKLKNGTKIIGVHMPGANTVTINFGFRTGSRSETKSSAGISHFLEHMVFKGSKKRPTSKDISIAADRLGAFYNAETDKEYTCYYIKTSSGKFSEALDIVGDMVTAPLLNQTELEKERGTVIEEIKVYNDNPMMDIGSKLEEVLYGDTPMGRDTAGNQKSLRVINSKSMRKYFDNYYVGSNATIVISGKLPNNYREQVSEYALRLPKGIKTNWVPAKICSDKVNLNNKKTEQAMIGLGLGTFPYFDKRNAALDIATNILGGSMSSRLFTEIREKRGWAYFVEAHNAKNSDVGYVGIYAGVKKDKVVESINLIIKELSKMINEITKEELERAKGNIEGLTELRFEDTARVAKYILMQDLFSKKIILPNDAIKIIKSIKINDVKMVLDQLNPRDLHLAVIGPFKDKQKFAKILNQK